ncbi:MAG: flagellar hook-basal body complex protein [Rhodobacteraceae bacterium]|nr:flagellar hook-basal body complex protein [Paracoccaceae bacterium]
MDNATYATLTRQSGLRDELQTLAHNIANVSTNGYQRAGLIFSEFVERLDPADEGLSMATARAWMTDRSQGQLVQTGGQFDFAIEGNGYFMVETAAGQRLTRAGAFSPNAAGELVTADGARLLDAGQTPVFIPAGVQKIHMADDGTLSADGQPLTQIGLFLPADPVDLRREEGTRFAVEGDIDPLVNGQVIQGFLEQSNVDPIVEISRLIEVQRAYEAGRNLLNAEDERIRNVVRTLTT